MIHISSLFKCSSIKMNVHVFSILFFLLVILACILVYWKRHAWNNLILVDQSEMKNVNVNCTFYQLIRLERTSAPPIDWMSESRLINLFILHIYFYHFYHFWKHSLEKCRNEFCWSDFWEIFSILLQKCEEFQMAADQREVDFVRAAKKINEKLNYLTVYTCV